ncbi:MAG: secondary thiamine-phosphate synthase enzyme YjbQ [Nitrosopumilaceae archaeon]|nr:secondary thiamine-phosphate synthase enzyme YjbQ [Nitrosopumilaceae archaeon]
MNNNQITVKIMAVTTKTITIKSKGENDIIDITPQVAEIVQESKIRNGNVTLFVSGSTASITTVEYEPGLVKDFPKMLARIAPQDIEYDHEKMWHDGNGHSHVKASLLGPSLTIPFKDNQLLLGTWQQIVFVELDTRSRERNLVVQILGE